MTSKKNVVKASLISLSVITASALFYYFAKEESKESNENAEEVASVCYVPQKERTENGSEKMTDKTNGDFSDLMSFDDIVDYYFKCENLSEQELEEQGETIPFMEDDDEQDDMPLFREQKPPYRFFRDEICDARVDEYLAYLQKQGLDMFLDVSARIDSYFDPYIRYNPLTKGLTRLGSEMAGLALLNLPLTSGADTAYYIRSDILIKVQEIIDSGNLDKKIAVDFYMDRFYAEPTTCGLGFILNNSTEAEKDAILLQLFYSDDESLRNVFFDYGHHNLPKEIIEKMYDESTDSMTKVNLLMKRDQSEVSEGSPKDNAFTEESLAQELEEIYTNATGEDKHKIITYLDHKLDNCLGYNNTYNCEASHSITPTISFLVNNFKASTELEDIILLGDALGDDVIDYHDEPNFKEYALEKAKQMGTTPEGVFILSNSAVIGDGYINAWTMCKIILKSQTIECKSGYD